MYLSPEYTHGRVIIYKDGLKLVESWHPEQAHIPKAHQGQNDGAEASKLKLSSIGSYICHKILKLRKG